jgi:hypothetical protein
MSPHTNIERMVSAKFKRHITRARGLEFNLSDMRQEKFGWERSDDLILQLAIAFFENDPYYPRPTNLEGLDRELWPAFSSEYLNKAAKMLSAPGKDPKLTEFPRKFIHAYVLRKNENMIELHR